jgi:hypothetical protein
MYPGYHLRIKFTANSQQALKKSQREYLRTYSSTFPLTDPDFSHVTGKQMHGALRPALYETFHNPPDG